MLHRFGHGLLVVLVACLCLVPVRAEADIITTMDPSGILRFSGTFSADNDVALIYFSLADTAVVTAQITSLLDTPAGFDPILTLFVAAPEGETADFNGYNYLSEVGDGFAEGVELIAGDGSPLSFGNYLLALTQDNNLFNFNGGFEYDTAPNGALTAFIASFTGGTTCPEFVSFSGDCRSRQFAGTLSVQPGDALIVQPVPEPGTLVLLMAGGAALLARRRRWRRPDASDRA